LLEVRNKLDRFRDGKAVLGFAGTS